MIVSKFLDKTPQIYLEVFACYNAKNEKIILYLQKGTTSHKHTIKFVGANLVLWSFWFFNFFCGGEKLEKVKTEFGYFEK